MNPVIDRRQIGRVSRQPGQSWQLRIDDDRLITKNISNLSPNGMAFKAPSSSDIRAGQHLRLSLSLVPGENFECEGRILWVRNSDDRAGAMKQIGVEFLHLPPSLDAAIMKQIHETHLLARRQRIEQGWRPDYSLRKPEAKLTWRSVALSALGAIVIMGLTAALLTAIWIHQDNHPEDNIAEKFNKGMIRKLSGVDAPKFEEPPQSP